MRYSCACTRSCCPAFARGGENSGTQKYRQKNPRETHAHKEKHKPRQHHFSNLRVHLRWNTHIHGALFHCLHTEYVIISSCSHIQVCLYHSAVSALGNFIWRPPRRPSLKTTMSWMSETLHRHVAET